MIENNGRPERTRTADLYRVKVAQVNNLGVVSLKKKGLTVESLYPNCARNVPVTGIVPVLCP